MGVTIMVSINSLVKKLALDFPEVRFHVSEDFLWSYEHQTVYYDISSPEAASFLLHELGHALLAHNSYNRDIELIKLERDAWEHASRNLAPRYGLSIKEDVIQDNLDTYRDWLHDRSQCPLCQSTGLQIKSRTYRCLACNKLWRVNEARLCALRKYSNI